jgi:hypothetical protein
VETGPTQREEFPLGAQAIGLCCVPPGRSRRVEEHKLSICAAPIRQKSANRSDLLRVFTSKNRAELLGQNEPREEEGYEKAFLFAGAVGISWLRRRNPCHDYDN